jgi:hypothetical protein
VFTSPIGLPPARGHCHRIRLLSGIEPVVFKAYEYVHHQKAELERQCCDMFAQGIICPSTSVFPTPMLLVKKADDSRHRCINYRVLNSRTIKDKFPIPVVEEYLDELHGVAFFSKLDPGSGYYQVLMHATDINKMAFWMHECLFEFLIMPFGLTNALASF